jgi:hypothetical protein
MKHGDRVKLVKPVGVYPSGCKGIVDSVGSDGYADVTLDENEHGNSISPLVPLPPSPKSSFVVM